jgi:hypothetical protein
VIVIVPLLALDPHPLVTRTQYCVVEVSAAVEYVAESLPTGVVAVPVVPWYHW